MGTEDDREGGGRTSIDTEQREALFAEYFQKMRSGDDAGAIKVLALILGTSSFGWWLLS